MPARISRLLHSIRFRLTLWFVLVLALALLVFNAFVYTRTAREVRLDSLRLMELRLRRLAQVFQVQAGRHNDDAPFSNTLPATGIALQEDEVLVLFTPQGQVVGNSGALSDQQAARIVAAFSRLGAPVSLDRPEERRGELLSTGFTRNVLDYTFPNGGTANLHGDYLFLVAALDWRAPGSLLALVGRPLDPSRRMNRLLANLALASLATLVLAFAGGYWLADRAMRPVRAITRAAREIGETDLHRRLDLGGQDELGELADTFDQMLARLQAAFERQRQFTADASHELRTPLTIVGLEADRALSGKRSLAEYERSLGVIRSENQAMTRLVNDLLTLARMDAGQAALHFEPLDLSDVALEVVERLAALAERSRVTLCASELPELRVRADRQYLTQMISNLVENAIKYAGGEGKKVCVETGQRPVDGVDLAWVRVVDNGAGISPEHLPHLFDRFYQVDKARSRGAQAEEELDAAQPSGSGLGLSIVQWIARAHGGEVSVTSQPGAGSTFEVTLPLSGQAE